MAISFSNGDLLTVRLNFAVIGVAERAMNVLHYRVKSLTGVPASITAGLSTIADEMMTNWGAAWKVFGSAEVGLLNVSVSNVFPLPRSVMVSSTAPLPIVGDQAGDTLPLQDAVTILKKTDIGARWGMGRIFVTGIPESLAESGFITPAGLTALGTMVLQTKSDMPIPGDGWSMILEPVLLRGPEDNPVSLTVVKLATLSDLVIKTQRRRRPGKGS